MAEANVTINAPPDTSPQPLLLTTKLYLPPIRAHLVPRPRLTQRLNEGLSHKLTLISAPAGFGKTTLLSEWIPHSEWCVTWVSLDEGDNDPTRFWSYFIAGLQRLNPELGKTALLLFQSPQPPPLESCLTTLLNEIATFPEPFVLVLDDYHVIENASLHEAITFLLDYLPPQLHLFITTRTDPPFSLSRLRGREQLTELRAGDLRFTPDEAMAFFNQVMGLDLSPDDVAALEAHTEGWIVGLQLAALTMQERDDLSDFITAFTGTHRYILDYLTDEVLERQPMGTTDFLLQTSILDRLCGPLCDAITGGNDGQTTLELLEQANLFIVPLDDERRWYRYHHLFADVLRHRLSLTQPQNIPEYHHQASIWFEQQGLAAEAIHHALVGQDFDRTATLIEPITLPLAMGGQQATVERWMAKLPVKLRQVRPRLALAYAVVAISNADFATVETYLHEAEAAAPSGDEERAALQLEVAALRTIAGSILGDGHAPELGQTVLGQLSPDHPLRSTIISALSYAAFAIGDLTMASQMLEEASMSQLVQSTPSAVGANLVAILAMVRRAEGRLLEARRMAVEVLDISTHNGRTLPISGALLAYLLLGLIQYEQNELDAAERTLRQCDDLARRYQVTMYKILAQFYLGYVLAAQGDLTGALRLVEQAEMEAGRYLSPLNLREFVGFRVLLWLKQGNLATASAWMAQDERTVDPDRPQFTAYDVDRFALVRTLMAEGRWAAAQMAVEDLLDAAETTGHGRFVIWALVWQALILDAQDDIRAALKALEHALVLAEPEGYVRIFVDEGMPMVALLERMNASREGGRLKEYISKLLTAFKEDPTERVQVKDNNLQPSSPNLHALVEPLTERELEVLNLIAAGLKNRVIGEELVITVGTVKRHISNIYGKLGVTNRVQAVSKARQLDLLP